jgi:hypothetical protein
MRGLIVTVVVFSFIAFSVFSVACILTPGPIAKFVSQKLRLEEQTGKPLRKWEIRTFGLFFILIMVYNYIVMTIKN